MCWNCVRLLFQLDIKNFQSNFVHIFAFVGNLADHTKLQFKSFFIDAQNKQYVIFLIYNMLIINKKLGQLKQNKTKYIKITNICMFKINLDMNNSKTKYITLEIDYWIIYVQISYILTYRHLHNKLLFLTHNAIQVLKYLTL